MKAKYFTTAVATVAMVAVSFSACNSDDLYVGDTNISSQSGVAVLSNVPFAEEQALADIALNPKNVSYNTARKLALVEMETGIKESMNWQGTKLSQKPVVIYDGQSNAKYYEFIVTNQQGQELGTVTTCAQKESDEIVACVLPFVRDYTALNTKGSGYQLISGGYPSRILLGVLGKAGEEPSAIIEPESGETVFGIPVEGTQGLIQSLAALSENEKAEYGITNVNALIAEAKEKEVQRKADAEEFWRIMDAATSAIDATTDEDIITTINSSKSEWTSYDEYRIPEFYNLGMYYTRWDGWCGPSAVAWIYRGLYSSYYNGTFLPFYYSAGFTKLYYRGFDLSGTTGFYDFIDKGDDDHDGLINDLDKEWITLQSQNADGGLYASIADTSGLYNYRGIAPKEGLTFPTGLSKALSAITNGTYEIEISSGLVLNGGHAHIRSTHLPAILVVEGLSHMVTSFGSRYRYWNWNICGSAFGIKIFSVSGKIKTDTWALVHDNGHLTGNWGYSPYWRGEVLGIDIAYKVIKLK
ncbi:hypothetical protein AGMMS4957_21710 [Bacteroidia bacterium]|nr:hypothetical protein AGMMS4957_21710 [Bacteroidia bacterium]